MLAQRAAQQSLRRFAAGQPSMISIMAMQKFAAPAVIGVSMQIRRVTTSKLAPSDSYDILVAQRKLRPVSPHLSIYKWQVPWILSITHRITGSILSGGFYIFGSAYLVAPLFGWHLDSISMAAAFGAWPVAAKVLAKFAVSMPFVFHSLNGVRHIVWDFGKNFANKNVIQTGWAVVGASVVTSLGLALFL